MHETNEIQVITTRVIETQRKWFQHLKLWPGNEIYTVTLLLLPKDEQNSVLAVRVFRGENFNKAVAFIDIAIVSKDILRESAYIEFFDAEEELTQSLTLWRWHALLRAFITELKRKPKSF